jgi:hypothetical protein
MTRSCVLVLIAACSLSVQPDAARLARLFAHVWMPELGPLPDNLDPFEAGLARVGAFAHAGDFASALVSLQQVERQYNDPRAAYLVPFFKRELIQRRGDYLGGTRPRNKTGNGVEDARNKMELDALWVSAMQSATQAKLEHRAAAGGVLMLGMVLRTCEPEPVLCAGGAGA